MKCEMSAFQVSKSLGLFYLVCFCPVWGPVLHMKHRQIVHHGTSGALILHEIVDTLDTCHSDDIAADAGTVDEIEQLLATTFSTGPVFVVTICF